MEINLKEYFNKTTAASTLAFFRILFGVLMLISIVRFWYMGWIETLYIQPSFHFTYYGFSWIKPLGEYTYGVFALCALSAIFITIGYKYRLFIILFFLTFTYIELIDKTTYLNHYYFVSVISFLLIFLPASNYFSIDAYQNPDKASCVLPVWCTDSIKIILGIVYFYAGLAKLNSDWLFKAMPLKIWLQGFTDWPFIGFMFSKSWVHLAFSWSGAIYDLIIPFLLLNKKTRLFGFVLVVVFHLLTSAMFPIGMFPYIMIFCTLLFFEPDFHQKVLNRIAQLFQISNYSFATNTADLYVTNTQKVIRSFVVLFIVFQLLFPFRYLVYPQELFWTEEGYRFSWRVMLMEKVGYAMFNITDSETQKRINVDNTKFLTAFQEKQMATQPDFILQYAHYLRDYYAKKGINKPQVRVDSYVAINGRLSKKYIDSNVNLSNEEDTFSHKKWILPFNETIKGF